MLAPLEPLKNDMLVLSNLTTNWGRPLQAAPGDHGRALGSYMTGVEVYKTAGADLKLGISADQIAANAVGHLTKLPSLEVGLEEARQAGNCDSGYSCAYVYNVSWKTESQPLPPISDPRQLFERLFGSDVVESPEAHARRLAMRQSILDSVLGPDAEAGVDAGRRRPPQDGRVPDLRARDRAAGRARRKGRHRRSIPGIDKPFGVPAEFPDYFRLMTDMMIIAFKADITRISTIMIGREGLGARLPRDRRSPTGIIR